MSCEKKGKKGFWEDLSIGYRIVSLYAKVGQSND